MAEAQRSNPEAGILQHPLSTHPDSSDNNRFQMVPVGVGIKLRVFTRDLDQDAVPLVFCNGLGQAIEILFPLMKELAGRPIIAFDAAGVGLSDVPGEPASIPDHAAMLTEVLDALGVDRCDVLGISWGGAVAQQLAKDMPTRVRKLVLAVTSAGGLGSWWGSPVALGEIFFPLRYSSKAYGNFIGPLMYGGEAVWNRSLFREYSKHAVAPSLTGYFAQVKALCSWNSLFWFGELQQPTQIIGGTMDALIPIANQMLLATLKPDAQLKVFQAGHLLMYSRRSEIGALVTEFLDA